MNMIIFKQFLADAPLTFLDIHRGISHVRVYSFFHWNAFRIIFFCIQCSNGCNTNIHCFLMNFLKNNPTPNKSNHRQVQFGSCNNSVFVFFVFF